MDSPVAVMELAPGCPDGPAFPQQLEQWLPRALPAWLPRQRWFGSKGRAIHAVEVRDVAELRAGAVTQRALTLVTVRFHGSDVAETYAVPVACLPEADAADLEPYRVMGRIRGPAGSRLLVDGVAEHGLRHALLEQLVAGAELAGPTGVFRFQLSGRTAELFPWLAEVAGKGGDRLLRAEQSNTSMIFTAADDSPKLLLKCFRRVMAGLNPDYEVTRALTEQTSFRAVPLLAGAVTWEPNHTGSEETAPREPWVLGIYQAFTVNEGDGWEYTLRELTAGLKAQDGGRRQRQLLDAIRLLARRTAELHLALAGVATEPALAPEPVTAEDLAGWEREIGAQVKAAGESLQRDEAQVPEEWRAMAAEVARRLSAPRAVRLPASLAAGVLKVRIHGDYHLGQVLRTGDDFVLFDFEGEPARPLAWRRRKWLALKDVAGMLRSFGYAAHVAANEVPEQPVAALAWETAARETYWQEWRETIRAGNPALLPEIDDDARAALGAFEMEKAVYELGYELHHRPDWVGIPLSALERLTAEET